VTAKWSKGLPPCDDEAPVLYFNSTNSDLLHYADMQTNSISVKNPLKKGISSSKGVRSSFAGG